MSTTLTATGWVSQDGNRKLKPRDASAYLGVSAANLERLVKSGEIRRTGDPLDNGEKLVRVEELDRLKRASI